MMKAKCINDYKGLYLMAGVFVASIMSFMISCVNNGASDDGLFVTPKNLDSLETEIQLDNIINGGYIAVDSHNRYRYPALKQRMDLRYLPYLYLTVHERYLPYPIAQNYFYMIAETCVFLRKDSTLYNIGKICIDRMNEKLGRLCEPDSALHFFHYTNTRNEFYDRGTHPKAEINDRSYDLDSLRIRIIGFNDRNALGLLEQYYNEINMRKELAVYYKVMLGFEGNGDLAERYYTTLKPYLKEQPEFYNSIREVLLRAAMCDHNERAQELCDSLGFSLCDYRMPLPMQ